MGGALANWRASPAARRLRCVTVDAVGGRDRSDARGLVVPDRGLVVAATLRKQCAWRNFEVTLERVKRGSTSNPLNRGELSSFDGSG